MPINLGTTGSSAYFNKANDKEKLAQAQAKSDLAQIKRLKAEADAQPKLQAFKSALNPDGILGKKYQIGAQTIDTPDLLNIKGLTPDQTALNALQRRALGQDTSWLDMQNEKLKLDELNQRDRAAQQALGSAAAAESALAMRGGISGGSRERLAQNMARNVNAAQQGIGRDISGKRLDLALADDQTRTQLLSQIPDMNLRQKGFEADLNKFNIGTGLDVNKFNAGQTAAAEQFNKGQALNQVQQLNDFNKYKYGQQMAGYAAGKTGDAIAAGGGGKGGIGK